ncbi:DUF4203 domain-containing protein [Gordonia sp. HY002]|uniref:DUF4203 domain-containing protein n=1 Tax=Gordonia zhenghanii TaxID=2911516 RepID=UPI001EEFFB51|nr:DUF4203 domain-containing protein [Gordonia zhenghanii]MCF8571036.1 DUF4203 domain-containing protein [Gordonia zhenghanii]MCF8606380.1 DUF4203 domain-containing protein [Gordonia zhenghanii]
MLDANGFVIVAVGALLCFYGVRSVHLGVLASGFGLGWLIAALFNPSALTLILFGLIGAVTAWVVVSLVFSFASYLIGGLAGAVTGARIADLVQPGDNSWAASGIIIVAVAAAAAFAAEKYKARALIWLTSIGGAAMILHGLGRAFDALDWLRSADTTAGEIGGTAAWIGVAVTGWVVQRRLFADRLDVRHRLGGNEKRDS